jgi:hypothetical protein
MQIGLIGDRTNINQVYIDNEMNNNMKYFFLICTIVVLGCAVKKTEYSETNNSLQSDKTFTDFFNMFSIDSAFQSERIKYPLSYFYYEDYSDSLSSKEIKIGEWRYINFADDSIASTYKEDAYSIEINEKDSINVDYLRKGIDNGISIIYSFEKDGGRWYLTKIMDRSN